MAAKRRLINLLWPEPKARDRNVTNSPEELSSMLEKSERVTRFEISRPLLFAWEMPLNVKTLGEDARSLKT